jgi:hypothetical protein
MIVVIRVPDLFGEEEFPSFKCHLDQGPPLHCVCPQSIWVCGMETYLHRHLVRYQ